MADLPVCWTRAGQQSALCAWISASSTAQGSCDKLLLVPVTSQHPRTNREWPPSATREEQHICSVGCSPSQQHCASTPSLHGGHPAGLSSNCFRCMWWSVSRPDCPAEQQHRSGNTIARRMQGRHTKVANACHHCQSLNSGHGFSFILPCHGTMPRGFAGPGHERERQRVNQDRSLSQLCVLIEPVNMAPKGDQLFP
jgi:hypothetical protein